MAGMLGDYRRRTLTTAGLSLSLNLAYALYHGALGVLNRSYWFLTLAAYYSILSVTRFSAVLYARRAPAGQAVEREQFVLRSSGLLLLLLACILGGSVYLTVAYDVSVRHHEIIMISLALYTFIKLTLAAVSAVRVRKRGSPLLTALRNISCADAAASIFSLQRSMLVSFNGMSAGETRIMNACTGTAAFLFVFALGAFMALSRRKEE